MSQLTHIGKEVNRLRKMDGDVGRMAKQLVKTWKRLLVDGEGGRGREEEGGGEGRRGTREGREGEERGKGKHKVREGGRGESERQHSSGGSAVSVPRDHRLSAPLPAPTSSLRCELLHYIALFSMAVSTVPQMVDRREGRDRGEGRDRREEMERGEGKDRGEKTEKGEGREGGEGDGSWSLPVAGHRKRKGESATKGNVRL